MDFFAFVTTWFWYVMAFGAGALVAWLVARQFVPAESPSEAIEMELDKRDARAPENSWSESSAASSEGVR